ncbi:hypothetical protein [Mycolicibacterium rhodesiae]|uniref:hypothetical protein n=1 Tax=Mycolicibacterium rhodesiae TaxID=36814 RepID=UPI001C1E1E8B|nr:hypothetical protein [Mycolicibacterium rhodesiae]
MRHRFPRSLMGRFPRRVGLPDGMELLPSRDGSLASQRLGLTITASTTSPPVRIVGQAELARLVAATLSGWDGVFTVLVRKRTARHIESCPTCDDYRRSLVNSVAMVGNAVIKKLS